MTKSAQNYKPSHTHRSGAQNGNHTEKGRGRGGEREADRGRGGGEEGGEAEAEEGVGDGVGDGEPRHGALERHYRRHLRRRRRLLPSFSFASLATPQVFGDDNARLLRKYAHRPLTYT